MKTMARLNPAEESLTLPAPEMDITSPPRPVIQLEKVTITYGRGENAVHALSETSLNIGKGDFVALVGPSGCGKSTILKLVSNLIRPSTGHVFVGGREVGAEKVGIGMAFQNPTMLPWLRIRDNVMLPLKIVEPYRSQYSAKKKTEFRDKAEALLETVGLKGFGDKYPWQLSGAFRRARPVHPRGIVGHPPEALDGPQTHSSSRDA
jgi:NitT/TauT family transport system ATP-binding protein